MEVVKSRKSVRTYDGKPLTEEDLKWFADVVDNSRNPYGIPIEYRFLNPKEFDLRSPVLVGETLYLAAKMERVPHFEEALGYSLEEIILKAWSRGIGTVWIGGTMNREAFESAMDLEENEIMPCVTPVGYPAEKRAARDAMLRRAVKAESRLEISEFAFEVPENDGCLGPLSEQSSALFGEALEMVRWAPSAVNKQPWRIVIRGGQVHFYEKPGDGFVRHETGDLQRIDVGIAMYHFVYGMTGSGREPSFGIDDPHLPVPDDWQYVATYTVAQ